MAVRGHEGDDEQDDRVGSLLLALDLTGTAVFAVSGAAVGVKHRLDLFGVCVLPFFPRRLTSPHVRLVSVRQVGSGLAELCYELPRPGAASPLAPPLSPPTKA